MKKFLNRLKEMAIVAGFVFPISFPLLAVNTTVIDAVWLNGFTKTYHAILIMGVIDLLFIFFLLGVTSKYSECD